MPTFPVGILEERLFLGLALKVIIDTIPPE
mgnify:CR=1 FL=1